METAHRRSGRCECGAVSLTLNGAPIAGVNCHCLVCQRLSGSGHVFLLLYPADKIEVKGKLSSYEYLADSGKMAKSHFCPGCGSHVLGTNERFPMTCGVMAACLDDSSEFRPHMSVFARRVQAWDHLEPGLPSFPGMPPMSA